MQGTWLALLGGLCSCAALLVPAPASGDVLSLVNPRAGTQPGPDTWGGGHNFPGASVPFGMVQFSPDTTPSDPRSGGYDYRDSHLRGFSLTHLNGAGCSLYGDFPLTPTTRAIRRSPATLGLPGLNAPFRPGFRHAAERATPGYYRVAFGGRKRRITTELTATLRTGMARFTFPNTRNANLLIDAGGSVNGNDSAAVQINPKRREITGSASSGFFCAQRPRYRVYFAARFDRPFARFGTWRQQFLSRRSTSSSDQKPPSLDPAQTAQAGAYVGFNTRQPRTRGPHRHRRRSAHLRRVQVRIGISFVGIDGARRNLRAENRRFAFGRVTRAARKQWGRVLGLINVRGGSARDRRTFYTALYHVFLAPRTFSDADRRYIGMDGQIHTAAGRVQYADLSGWDIYRTQIPLLAMLMPGRTNDVITSMLIDAAESGCLPRWPYANGQSMTMVGDPSDPIIASAAAFGASGFNRGAALQAMVKGATQRCVTTDGSYVQRQGLNAYQSLGYVPGDLDDGVWNGNSMFGTPDTVWASASTTLEYATADFAIAQFAARFAGAPSVYSQFIQRSANWKKLFNPASGYIEPRLANGDFPSNYDVLTGSGFAEGNAVQYTWMVPHDPAGLAAAMGGPEQATARLDAFLAQLNAAGGAGSDHALLGNEPNLNVPWLYDWLGRPDATQAVVRRALGTLYGPGPTGYPGNDDLGTMSAWYVFGALGLYPEVPGVGLLALSSPLFPDTTVKLPGGVLTIKAPGAPAAPYIGAVNLGGAAINSPWASICAIRNGGQLSYGLSSVPTSWGAGAPAPSFGPQSPLPQGECP